jgi:MYXO-CTERM domain-containing protein
MMKKTIVTGLALLLMAGSALAVPVDMVTTDDAYLDNGNPDTNNGVDAQHCVTGRDQQKAAIYEFDLTAYAGEAAVGDGVLNLRWGWGESSLPTFIYELTGGTFDETVVTFNNYVGVGQPDCKSILGDQIASQVGSSSYSMIQIPVPQATVQKLIDGTAQGFALVSAPETYINQCWGTEERGLLEGLEDQVPSLQCEVTPEPATLALLGLGGLVALRRRR